MSVPSEQEKAKFMARAVELSKEGSYQGLGKPFGAVIVKDGKIVAESPNLSFVNIDPTAHAEVSVIRKACTALKKRDLNDCYLYTSCHPCDMCMAAIYVARVGRFYFATIHDDLPSYLGTGTMRDDMNKPDDQKTIPRERILAQADAAKKVVMEWVYVPKE